MSDPTTQNGSPAEGTAKIVYILYLVGIAFGPAGIVGVIMAYVNKTDAPDWLQSHYQFQIRTFWIGAIYIVIGLILSLILIGWFILIFWAIWLLIRSIKGMKSLDQHEAHPNPTSWMFG